MIQNNILSFINNCDLSKNMNSVAFFNQLPVDCIDLVLNFSSINWKKRFTVNVLPYIKTIHEVGITSERCASCYIDRVIQSVYPCSSCNWHTSFTMDLMDFKEFKTINSNAYNMATLVQATSYEAFKNWCVHADRFYVGQLHMQIRTEYMRREFIRDTQNCGFVFSSEMF